MEVGETNKETIDYWALAEKIADKLKNDSGVEAIWVCGSFGRGDADEFSDLDMIVLVEESSFLEFTEQSRKEKWISIGARWDWDVDQEGNKGPYMRDSFVIGDACIYIEYVERILKCGWNEL